MLGEVCNYTGLNISHLSVYFSREVVKIIFHLINVRDLRCLERTKAIAVEVLVETSTTTLNDTLKLAFETTDSFSHHDGFLVRSPRCWTATLREGPLGASGADAIGVRALWGAKSTSVVLFIVLLSHVSATLSSKAFIDPYSHVSHLDFDRRNVLLLRL